MSHVRNAKLLPALLGLTVLALLTGGCASFVAPEFLQTKSLERDELDGTPGAMTETGLREEVLRFANRYNSEIGAFGLDRAEDTTRLPERRLAALRLTLGLTTSAIQISIGPHPVVNLLDMMVLTSLTRQRAETGMEVGGYYRPEDVAAILPSLVSLEADIWAVGARLLTPEQLASLRVLIDEWLRENPDQEYVADIRLDAFAAEHGEDELAEAWAMGFIPGVSLVPEVDRAAAAADQMRLLLERYLVYVQHLPSVLRWESQQAYFQFILQPEVNQLLADVSRVAASSERIAAFMERLPQEEEHLRELSADVRQTILAGTELATIVERTVGSADAFLVGIEERQSPGTRAFDIVEWRNMAVEIGVASRHLNETLAQINALVSSDGWSRNLPQLVDTLDRAELASEKVVFYGFRQSLILIGVFLGGSLVTGLVFQWAKRKLFDAAR